MQSELEDYSDEYVSIKLTCPECKLLEKLGRVSSSFPFNCRKHMKFIPKQMIVKRIKEYIMSDCRFNKKLIGRYLKIVAKLEI